jgi:hypothetical protein
MQRFLVEDEAGRVLAGVHCAGSLLGRVRGLLGVRGLARGEGLWIVPCNGVHTFGMRFALDVVTLDRSGSVLGVARGVAPWRVVLPVFGGHSVLELPSGGAEGIVPGMRLRFVPVE